jgi:hypothetical protein
VSLPRFGYFVVQVRAGLAVEESHLTGMLENLGTGERQAFQGSEGLARLLEEWGKRAIPKS